MAKRYRPVPRDQPFLLPPDMRDWLPTGHPVWLVIEVVDRHLDTSAVHATRRAGGAGAAGYDPDMLTALLVWAYANRVTSSRRIEALCRTDIAFKVICAGQVPDHVTIARFRAGLGPAAAALFDQVLVLCARLGMGRLGLVALDGMKIAASASLAANRTEDGLRKLAAQLAAEHAATDAAEDALFGPGVRGDEVPAELADPRIRRERITAALAELQAEQDAARQARDQQASARLEAVASGRATGRHPAAADVAAAQLRLDQVTAAQQARLDDWHARNAATIAATGKGLRGRVPVPPADHVDVRRAAARLDRALARKAARDAARKGPGPVRNLTDPHSRLMPVRGGFLQGYNTQNVTSSDGLIIATRLTTDPVDTPWFEPMLHAAQDAAARIAAHRPPASGDSDSDGGQIGLLLADAGYLSEHNLTIDGPDRLIATGKHRNIEKTAAGQPARGGWNRAGPATTAMAARLATADGITAYRHRGHIGERPHGHIKHNMGFRQLSVRGIPRVTAEWNLACTVANLFKAITAGHLTRQALTALAA
ncbi:MAG: transposase [Streptosporangiaceae bacterium]